MIQRSLKFFVISGDKRLNEMMRGFDLSFRGKIFGTPRTMVIKYERSEECDQKTIQGTFDFLLKKLQDEYEVAYFEYSGQKEDEGRWFLNHDISYRNPDFKLFSDGRKVCSLDDYLKARNE